MIQVPVDRFRRIVERWLAEFDDNEQGYQALSAASGMTANAWRKRLSDNATSGWWRFSHLDEADVDEVLSLIDWTHAWQTDLADLLPPRPRVAAGSNPKRRGVPCRIPDDDLRKMHRLHTTAERLSLNSIAKQVYERYGYSSHVSCATGISKGWRRLGLRARARIEMVVAVSTTSGLSPRDHRLRYARRRAAGLTNKGKPRQPLCTTDRCKRKRMHGEMFCETHHPDRIEKRLADLADMRTRSPRQNPANLTTVATIQPALHDYWERVGMWKPLTTAGGPSNSVLRRYLIADPEQKIMRDTARRILDAIDAAAPLRVAA